MPLRGLKPMKNLGTLGFSIAVVLLLGHGVTSGVSAIAYLAWKLVAFIVSLLFSVAVFWYVEKETEQAGIAWLFSGMSMLGCLLIVGALT